MIERVVVDGRAGSACFVDGDGEPVDEAKATFLKIVFDDGGQLILNAQSAQRPDENASSRA